MISKIKYHIMPWEIDYALLTFTQLKKSSYYLSTEDEVRIDITLNLSSYLINSDQTYKPDKKEKIEMEKIYPESYLDKLLPMKTFYEKKQIKVWWFQNLIYLCRVIKTNNNKKH